MEQVTEAPVVVASERNFDLVDLITVLEGCQGMLAQMRSASPQNQWLCIFEVHQMIYSVVVTNTCLDLHAFNRLGRLYDVTAMAPEEWIRLLLGYCETFLKASREEYAKYGNSEG